MCVFREELELVRPDAKIFLGMLARTATEEDVRQLVSPYGQVVFKRTACNICEHAYVYR